MCRKNAKGRRLIIAGVILLAGAPCAMATLVDSNSIVKDGIEYYFQTDKCIYNLGENAEMLYRVTNLGENDATFRFTGGPVEDRCDYIVEKGGERIWDNLQRPSTLVITSFTLSSLESRVFINLWDMTDFGGLQITPGNYDVTGSLDHFLLVQKDRYVPVSVQIDVVPEPATLLLFAAGLTGLLARSRTNLKK